MSPVQPALLAWLAPVVVALLLMVYRPLRHTGRPAAWLSVGAAATTLVSSILTLVLAARAHEPATLSMRWLVEAGETMGTLGVHVDGVSATMLVVVSVVAFSVQVFSLEYMADEDGPGLGRYYTWQSLFLFSMNGLVLAPNMLQLFLSWELVGLCSYLLIGFWYLKPSAARAALKAFWMTKLADIGLIVALYVQYVAIGDFGWGAETATALSAHTVPWLGGVSLATVVAGGFFFAAMGKSAQFPLHIWLPDAMEGPTPVSALLHAATMVAAGVYMVVRSYPIFEAAPAVLTSMALIGAVTAFFAASVAVVQSDIKKVLAYSTVSQLGYMVAALGTGSFMAGYFHLTTHAFFKALLFLGAGSIIHSIHSQELSDMGGLLKKMPLTSAMFMVGTLALAGIPVFSGFFSKDLILEVVLHEAGHQPVLYVSLVLLLAGVGLTAFYMGRVLWLAFFGPPSDKVAHAHRAGPAQLTALTTLAVLAVVAGFGGSWLSHLYGVEPYHFHVTPIGVASLVTALTGLGLSWVVYGRGPVPAALAPLNPLGDFIRSGLVDRSWAWGYRVAMMGLARSIAWFDRYIIDALVNVAGVVAIEGGRRIRSMQTGKVGDYVYAVIIGLIVFAAFTQVMP